MELKIICKEIGVIQDYSNYIFNLVWVKQIN